MMAAAAHERRLDRVCGVVVMPPRQNNIARLRRPSRANVSLARWIGTGAPERQGGLKTAASADVAAE
jgi:hypothetical protein